MSLDSVKILLAPLIGGDRVLFSPVKPAMFKILSLLSDIIHMMPYFVCHFFSCFLLCYQSTILRNSSLPIPTRFWVYQWIFNSIYSVLVVGYTWHAGLELRVVGTGGPRRHHWWLKLLHLDSIVSCLVNGLVLFSVLFVLPIERCHIRMASYKCANWRNLGTIIWLNSFFHHGSMFFMSPWWSGSTSGLLDLYVSAVSHIALEMSSIPSVALSPPLCGEHRSWRARTGQLKSVRINGKIWGILLASCYKCVSQYFQLVGVLCLTVDFMCQRGSHPCCSLVSKLLRSSRIENTGPRVYREMPLINTLMTRMLIMWICWRP